MEGDFKKWLYDISNNHIYFTFAAQNHIYGCLSLLEQIEDGDVILDISGQKEPVIIYKDISGEFQLFHFSDSFHMIGNLFGFCDEEYGIFLGWDDNYKNSWINLILNHQNSLENIEQAFFDFFISKFRNENMIGKCAFEAIVQGKNITDDMKTVFLEDTTGNIQKHERREKTYRAKRNTTPLYRRRGFNKTRKRSVLKN